MTEAVQETFGRSIEPAVNRIIENMMQHLPEDAADMCGYLLEFASSQEPSAPIEQPNWLEQLGSTAVH